MKQRFNNTQSPSVVQGTETSPLLPNIGSHSVFVSVRAKTEWAAGHQ